VNVLLWNYRGYGRSEGIPDPTALKKDGEAIVEYLRKVRNVQKIGAHGQSMGGLVASHLGRYAKVDFVFCDRTFSSFNDVTQSSLGSLGACVLKAAHCWKTDSALDFYYSNCYKISASDAKDSIINTNASLKSGISRIAIEKELIHHEQQLSYGGITKIRERRIVDMVDYSHILNANEMRVFFKHLANLYELIVDICLNTRKEKLSTSDEQPYTARSMGGDLSQRTFESYDTLSSEIHLTEDLGNDSGNGTASLFFTKKKKLYRSNKLLKEKQEKYKEMDGDGDETDFKALHKFLVKIYRCLEKLDSAGETLLHIF